MGRGFFEIAKIQQMSVELNSFLQYLLNRRKIHEIQETKKGNIFAKTQQKHCPMKNML
jgi:hypothetical protein